MCEFHGPFIMLLFLINFPLFNPKKLALYLIVNNTSSFCFYMILGMITNARWIYTLISQFILTLTTLMIYGLHFKCIDYQGYIQMSSIALFMVYACYSTEYKMKHEFLQLHHIKAMNDDLTNLLINLPEGIILYDEKKRQVVLANHEFKRIFRCND